MRFFLLSLSARLLRCLWRATGDWRARVYSRHTMPEPARCGACGAVFRQRDAIHTYKSCGGDDVEPIEECPKCGEEL